MAFMKSFEIIHTKEVKESDNINDMKVVHRQILPNPLWRASLCPLENPETNDAAKPMPVKVFEKIATEILKPW